jgi:hypothetical protein
MLGLLCFNMEISKFLHHWFWANNKERCHLNHINHIWQFVKLKNSTYNPTFNISCYMLNFMWIEGFQKQKFAWPYEDKKTCFEFFKFGENEKAIRFICKVTW